MPDSPAAPETPRTRSGLIPVLPIEYPLQTFDASSSCDTMAKATTLLASLQSSRTFTDAELTKYRGDVLSHLGVLSNAVAILTSRLQKPDTTDVLVDSAGWGVAIAGSIIGYADIALSGILSLLGGVGLVFGVVGFCQMAMVYQRRQWQRNDDEDDLATTLAHRKLLGDILISIDHQAVRREPS